MKKVGKIKFVLLGALMMVVCVFMALLMTGCDTKKDNGEIESVPVLTDTRGEDVVNATITDMCDREVTYNKNAKKIVALAWEGDLVALGIKPLAVSIEKSVTDMYKSYFGEVGYVDTFGGLDPEVVLSYQPDLIIMETNPTLAATLSDIAPVITVEYSEQDYATRINYLAGIFGLEDNAKQLLDYAEEVKTEAIEKAKKMELENKSITVFGVMMQGVTVMPGEMMSWKFDTFMYKDFGMKKTDAVEEFLQPSNFDNIMSGLSNESIPNYEGDYTLFVDTTQTGEIPPTVQTNPGWLSLKAVKENRVGILDSTVYGYKDLLFLSEQYNQLFKALETATGKKA